MEMESKLVLFMDNLDEKSRALVWHVWRNGHAGIGGLTRVIGEESDSLTLIRIREVINPLAEKILGKDILSFKESRTDPLTGNKIPFSWWINNEVIEYSAEYTKELDVFDEEGFLRIVAELPPVEENEIKINLGFENGYDILTISAGGFYRKIPLFHQVEKKVKKTFRNRVLEVQLRKLEEAHGNKY